MRFAHIDLTQSPNFFGIEVVRAQRFDEHELGNSAFGSCLSNKSCSAHQYSWASERILFAGQPLMAAMSATVQCVNWWKCKIWVLC